MAYNVFIFNGLPISGQMDRRDLSTDQLLSINRILQGYFEKVVRAHDALRRVGGVKYNTALVQWNASFQPVAPHEILIYLLPNGVSIAQNQKLELGKPAPDHDGFTRTIAGTTASEVYYNFTDVRILANLMFHEAMHNKLGWGNRQLHSRGGLGNGPSGGTGPLTPESQLTEGNINDMASGLELYRPQWTDGRRLLADAWMKPDSDPTKGLF